MNSRERVLAALDHQEPDRVPIDLGSTVISSIHKKAYVDLKAYLGMPVRKSGRTTGFTTGEILLMDATVSVSYGVGQTAQFDDQLIAGPMSQGGDSGSLVVAGDSQEAVGLLFAGSNQTTIFNPIQRVLDALNIEI